MDFNQVTILGGGLLGGSLALALEKLPAPPRTLLWARRRETADEAKRAGVTQTTDDLTTAVRNADLLVLAVPVGAMPALLADAITAGLPKSCLITDVGSVKSTPHATIRPILAGSRLQFIGSHPMAGSEQGGVSHASASLFQNAACLLTNDDAVDPAKTRSLETFWQSVGCRTTWMSAAEHDALVARISHLPHAIAAAAARVCLSTPEDGAFGGGGLKDTTRVAAGNPEMWAEILTANRESLISPMRQTIDDLQALLALLESGDQEATRQWLTTAKDRRDSMPITR